MPSGDEYRALAADMMARSKREPWPSLAHTEFEYLALLYLRLADQADLNSRTDIVYETPPQDHQPQQQRQA
jgi:hypothetical protein